MRSDLVADLADCSEFQQTIRARPPRIVHGTVILATALLVAGLLWAAFTEVDLVVTAPGVVRPVTSTQAAKARFGGRVVQVSFQEGQAVSKGDILVQLDTEKLDNEILKHRQTLCALEGEQNKGAALLETLARQHKADRAAIEARLAQAQDELLSAQKRRELDIRQAKDDLREAEREEATMRRLAMTETATRSELDKSAAKVREARTKLTRAELPVEESKVTILRQELLQATEGYAVKRQEAEIRQAAKQGQVETTKKDLDNLRWEREQACIRAPIDGVIVSGNPKEGEIVEPGRVIAELAVQKGFHFEVQVSSADVALLREGTPARIKLTSFDYERYGTLAGKVCYVSPDSKASETNGSQYTVRIELAGDEVGRGESRGQVKLGMAGQAEIVTQRETVLKLLGKKVRQAIRLG
jgi:multidrug efflux pump subunit AcrA (membrane-fusion protein)